MTIKQIAAEVGKSERTVKRDLARVRSYVKGQCSAARFREEMADIEKFNSLSWSGKCKMLKELANTRRLLEGKPRLCRCLQVIVDLDAVTRGEPALKVKPRLPVRVAEETRLNLDLLWKGKTYHVGRLEVHRGKLEPGLRRPRHVF